MFENARKFLEEHSADKFLLKWSNTYIVLACLFLMWALVSHNTNIVRVSPYSNNLDTPTAASIDFDTYEIDNAVFWIIDASEFTFTRQTLINNSITYEIIEPQRWCSDELIQLYEEIARVWESTEIQTIRIVSLNKNDTELVDYIIENGTFTWKR